MHGFQIWVNLPAKDKMMSPRYQDIPSSDLPTVESTDGKVWAKVVAGEAMGAKAVIDTVMPIQFIHYKMQAGSNVNHAVASDLNVMVYMFGGSAKINGKLVEDGQLALLTEGSEIELASNMGAEFLVLAGPEINEPIARYGPFVMNTRQEIHQAVMDFQNGTLA
jgi:redox-sensitive bicupin YhaK (pirin superfamily)